MREWTVEKVARPPFLLLLHVLGSGSGRAWAGQGWGGCRWARQVRGARGGVGLAGRELEREGSGLDC